MFKINRFRTIICLVISIVFMVFTSNANAQWEQLETGLELGSFAMQEDSNAQLAVLRFDPKYFEFNVFSISETEGAAKTLMHWAESHDLVAAINASMYLPDGKTSTGYMRKGEHLNNKHIAKNFGAFFISGALEAGIASARLIDRDTKDWELLLNKYKVVVQNYRLIDSNRKVLWSAGGQAHSIAAVAQDDAGNILFLHCREPIVAADFANMLLTLPLNVRTVMYVEGGVQAGLVLRGIKEDIFWGGSHPSDIFMGSVSVALPNIIGVTRKKNMD